jgi:NAD(P)-dependent dehydrogenase (short-subunit alcohol dehydrogenase family)
MATALIIGASRGLGRALAEEHLKRGWTVIATARKPEVLADLAAAHDGRLRVEAVDTVDWAGVEALRERLSGRALDLLFVNAGISGPRLAPIGEVDAQAFTELMLVNALAPLRLIDRFIDLIPKDGVAAAMTSGLGSVAGNTTGGWEAYRMSKAALNMGLRSLAVRHAAGGRTFLAVTPGWVRTDMGGQAAPLSIEQSIPSLTDMLERRRGSGGVAFVNYEDRELPW